MISTNNSEFSHQIADSLVQNGRLVGCLRLGGKSPSAVLPVFIDADNLDAPMLLYQRIDEMGLVLKFVEDRDLNSNQLLSVENTGQDHIVVSIGDPAAQAYEINEMNVFVAQGDVFRERMSAALDDETFSGRPFTGLGVARFLGDAAAERRYLEACNHALSTYTPRMAQAGRTSTDMGKIVVGSAGESEPSTENELGTTEEIPDGNQRIVSAAINFHRKFADMPRLVADIDPPVRQRSVQPNFRNLISATTNLKSALRTSSSLPAIFPLVEVEELLETILLFPDSSPQELPTLLQAAESVLSDLRNEYVPRNPADGDDKELPGFGNLRQAASEVVAELRGVFLRLDPVVVAATTPTSEELAAFAPEAGQVDLLAEVVNDTREADAAIERGKKEIEQNNYHLVGINITIKLNDLKIGDALIRAIAKLDMVRLHWLEKLGGSLAKAPEAILTLAEALPPALGAIEIVARELREGTARIASHLNQLSSGTTQLSHGIRPDLSSFRDAEWSPEMVVIPQGTFLMGSPVGEEDRDDDEGPQHDVAVSGFALGRYPVTFEDYDRYCEAKRIEKPGDEDWGRGRRPVINVSWEDAQNYIIWLNETLELSLGTYRLPSEAEWEYACRAGTASRYSGGDHEAELDAQAWETELDAHAWHRENSDSGSHRVSEKLANPWGLFDMHGNVWEWTEDRWHDNYNGASGDGSAWIAGNDKLRVLRGGSWNNGPRNLRVAARNKEGPEERYFTVGFRLARTLSR
jgi:formylglycine-generating enzyme required for sulfatase activity